MLRGQLTQIVSYERGELYCSFHDVVFRLDISVNEKEEIHLLFLMHHKMIQVVMIGGNE